MKNVGALMVVLALGGCGHASSEPGYAPPPDPVPVVIVEPLPEPAPASAARVSVSSVTLGDYCPEMASQGASGAPARFAADADYGTSHCQIVLTVEGAASGRMRVVSATLLDEHGRALQPLGTGSPQIWRGDSYQPWNEQLETTDSTNVLYSLSRIDWSRVPDSYSRPLRVQLVVEVDGQTSTITSTETIREAMIVT